MTQHQRILGDKVAISETDFAELERKARAVDWYEKYFVQAERTQNPDGEWVHHVWAYDDEDFENGRVDGTAPTWLSAVEAAMEKSK